MFSEEYGLVVVSSRDDKEAAQPATSITLVKELSAEEYEALDLASPEIAFYWAGVDLINAVIASYSELIGAIEDASQEFFESRTLNSNKVDDISAELSRLTLNLLSIFRSFVDHGDAALTRRLGAESSEFREWKRLQSLEFDSCYAYRLFSQLRNYTQHVGMPPIHFNFFDAADHAPEARFEFHASRLLETYGKWTSPVKYDLLHGAQVISVAQAASDWFQCFVRLANSIQSMRRAIVLDAILPLATARSCYSIGRGGALAIMPLADLSGDSKAVFTIRWLSDEKAQAITDDLLKVWVA